MFKNLLVAAGLMLSLTALSQTHSLTGLVQDARHQVLTGATVQVSGMAAFAVTDELGRFRLDKLPTGEHTLVVKFLGYADGRQTVTVPVTSPVEITLEESAVMTDEVVVYATRATDKTPATFSSVSHQTIQKQNFGQDLPLLLNWTPSAVTTSDAGNGVGYTGIRIRGSDATRVNVTINGIPYNDSESLGTFWVNISDIASSSQSIQIQRGVGSSTNGAGAFGGTLSLQTNTRNDQPYATATNAYGSFGTRRHTFSLGTGLLNNHWVIDGRISRIASDGFIDRASSDLRSYYFSAGFYAGKTMIKAIAFGGKERTYQAWYGVPQSRLQNNLEAMQQTAINESWNDLQTQNLLNSGSRTFNPYLYNNQVDNYQQDNYQLHFSHRIDYALTANVALHYTPGKGYYEEYRYKDKFSNYGIASPMLGDSVVTRADIIRRRWLDNDFYGLTYSLNYDANNLNVTWGGAWNRYVGAHFGEVIWAEVATVPTGYRYYDNTGEKRDFNSYLKATYQFTAAWSAYADLQYRSLDYRATGNENKGNTLDVSAQYHFFNPKAGIVFTPSEGEQFYASYSIGKREPVRDDFVDAPAGKTPQHERLRNLEAGYKVSRRNFNLNVNYYLMNYRNQLVLTGQVNDVGASIRTNVRRSYRQGIEVEGITRLSSKLVWNANVTVSRNKILKFTEVLYDYGPDYDQNKEVQVQHENTDISFSPNIIAGSALSYRPLKNLEAAWMTKYVGQQYLDNTSNANRRIDAYVVNDLRLSYTIQPKFMREIALSVLVNNILNETYESNGYTWGFLAGSAVVRENYYYPQAGRNFMAMVTLKF